MIDNHTTRLKRTRKREFEKRAPLSQLSSAPHPQLEKANRCERSGQDSSGSGHDLQLRTTARPPPSRLMVTAPLLRVGALDLVVFPAHSPQPPPQQRERTGKHVDHAAAPVGPSAIPRRALRPDEVFEFLLQRGVVPVRRCVRGRDAREDAGAHGLQELQEVRDLQLFGGNDGRVTGGRVRTCTEWNMISVVKKPEGSDQDRVSETHLAP